MRIGIIGTGNMGRALGLRWAELGHEVLFGSRDASKAERVAASAKGGVARAGDFDAAAAFGEVVLYTIRSALPKAILRSPRALAGKVVIDCNNSAILGLEAPDAERAGIHFATPTPSLAERLAADIPEAHVVKAFNTMSSKVIELPREQLGPRGVSVFLCSDDPKSKSIVAALAEELGFVAVDSGELERSGLVESVADFIRFQIVAMGTGPFATISVQRGSEP